MQSLALEKVCTKCKQAKSLEAFRIKDKVTQRRRSECRCCEQAKKTARLQAEPEKLRAQSRTWNKRYYERRKEVKGEVFQALVKQKTWRNRAAKFGAIGDVTLEDFERLCQEADGKCLCCGRKARLTMDHIVPLSKGGGNDISNIQPLCMTCNNKKNDRIIDYRK